MGARASGKGWLVKPRPSERPAAWSPAPALESRRTGLEPGPCPAGPLSGRVPEQVGHLPGTSSRWFWEPAGSPSLCPSPSWDRSPGVVDSPRLEEALTSRPGASADLSRQFLLHWGGAWSCPSYWGWGTCHVAPRGPSSRGPGSRGLGSGPRRRPRATAAAAAHFPGARVHLNGFLAPWGRGPGVWRLEGGALRWTPGGSR